MTGMMTAPQLTVHSVPDWGYAGRDIGKMSDFNVLLISADAPATSRLEALLREEILPGAECVVTEALFDGLRAIQDKPFDLIVAELFLPDGQGLATLSHLKQHAPKTPVIALCHARDRATAVAAVKKGAHDFFCFEDFDTEGFRRSVGSALSAGVEVRNAERRGNPRFDCRLSVNYQTLEKPFFSGTGLSETLNISSKGVLFKTAEPLEPGQLVQVSVDWPVRLENQVPLKLVAEGRVVRNVNGQAAMSIEKYEFKTSRRAAEGAPEQ